MNRKTIITILWILLAICLLFLTGRKAIDTFVDFVDENGKVIDINAVEKVEQDDAEKYIQSDSVVLELGGRYGTVSAIINKKLKDPTNHVVVEPDQTVWASLEKN